jgi:hypothetical protein
MKSITYALILAVGLWPALGAFSPSVAQATSTDTNTDTNTNTNCATTTGGYQNSSFSHCVKADNQENSQSDTKDLNDSGAQQSMMLGMMATAAGAGMVAAGMACAPSPCTGLISAGAALIMAGMMGMQAAGNMAQNAGIADWQDYKMKDLPHNTPGTDIDPGSHGTPGIDIDDSFTRTGKSGVAFDDFENKTGIDRSALVDGLKSGQSVASILAGSDKLKAQGVTEAAVQGALDEAAAGPPLSADEVMNQLGMTPEELAAMAKNSSGSSEGDGSYNLAGGAANRNPASDATNSFGSLLGTGASKDSLDGSVIGGALGKGALSSDVQAALDKNGITDLSIFQMVHQKYKVKTPMMFGESARKPSSATENPFSNLGSGGQIEF